MSPLVVGGGGGFFLAYFILFSCFFVGFSFCFVFMANHYVLEDTINKRRFFSSNTCITVITAQLFVLHVIMLLMCEQAHHETSSSCFKICPWE